MITSEKIKKWEEDIARIQNNQRSYDQKCTDRIRELRRKVQEETRILELENNQLIAEAVRTVYGEVTEENVEKFKQQMMALVSPAPDPEGYRNPDGMV